MSLKLVRGKTFPIGVDLGTSTVKLAQLRTENDQLELVGAASVEIPHPIRQVPAKRHGFLVQAIRKILRATPFRGRQCVLSLPADETVVQHVKIPQAPSDEVEPLLRRELEGKLPFPVDQAVIRHVVAGDAYGDGQSRQEVIVFCTSRAALTAYLSTARRAKLDVIGVNVESCAIVECFSRLFRRSSDTARAILYIDMGAASTQVVFAHGRKMVFSRNLPIAGEQLDQAVAEAMGIPADRAHAIRTDLSQGRTDGPGEAELHHMMDRPLDLLADEVTKCLRYYESVFRGNGVERAIFVGGGAYDKHLCQSLAQRLNLPAQIGDPLVRVQSVGGTDVGATMDRRQPHPDWAVAVGLSLGAGIAA